MKTRKSASTLSLTMALSCRVDVRPVTPQAFHGYTGRLESLSVTGCTIRTAQRPTPGDVLGLWMYLPGLSSALRVDQAEVTWGFSDAFTVEFLVLPVAEQLRLGDYLTETVFFVDAPGGLKAPFLLTHDNKEKL